MTNKELTLAQLMRAMIKYDGGDAPRIQHFVKVHDFARMIAIAEGMNQEDLFVLEQLPFFTMWAFTFQKPNTATAMASIRKN